MSNVQNEALLEILPDIERAARHVATEWSTVVEREDLEQEIVLHLLTKDYAAKVLEMEVPARRRVLFRIGTQIASQESVDLEYFSGNVTYTPSEVRKLLSDGSLVEEPSGDPLDAGAEAISVDRLDLRLSFEQLSDAHRDLLVTRYVEGRDYPSDTVRKATNRAVDALTQAMNRARRRAHEEYGSR